MRERKGEREREGERTRESEREIERDRESEREKGIVRVRERDTNMGKKSESARAHAQESE